MITEIPTAVEFQDAGLNQIYLAWQIAMQTTQEYERAQGNALHLEENEIAEAGAAYWLKSQPILANAFGLVQQAMEMSLKGRIAAISPYLLIARDPKDWPSKVDIHAVPFSDFRTLDAADLIKVHNTFSEQPLNEEFRIFWDGVRRDRNKLMHSISTQAFNPSILIRAILLAVETLFSDIKWPLRLIKMEEEGKYAAYGIGEDFQQNIVMGQIETALGYLDTSEKKRFLSYDSKRRAYVCPNCWYNANRDWQEEWPSLAQLTSKTPECTKIHCIVCDEETIVERIDCTSPDCKGNVVYEDRCLTCLSEHDSPYNFRSKFEQIDADVGFSYRLDWKRGSHTVMSQVRVKDDIAAIEHTRQAMSAPHLLSWENVIITTKSFEGYHLIDQVVGTLSRHKNTLEWHPNYRPPDF
ncbi:hypothetical protein [Methylobacterium sp. Leaf399]|uniref:hypothetical protein n=1 Tax=Methylobacterium sp. Leaf399 TaxID=1736364 RepID=UPI000AD838CF|nr:hypothetical protein [Methylobacterium sp. Leaf399]